MILIAVRSVFTSTYVDRGGKVIRHIDDGDDRVYLVDDPSNWDGSKNDLTVVGFEDPHKKYKPGDQYVFYFDQNKDNDKKWIGMAFRGGGKNNRDRNLKDFPIKFIRWFHKYYKEPGDPDRTREELEDIYEEWLDLGEPEVDFTKNPVVEQDNTRINIDHNRLNPNFKRTLAPVGTAVGVGTILYWIISEGSRVIPVRDVIPLP